MKRTYHRCSNPICGIATDKPGLCVVCQIEAEEGINVDNLPTTEQIRATAKLNKVIRSVSLFGKVSK